jgi:Nif-specific regulatory protein
VLENKEIIRIGETYPVKVDVRIITAQIKNLKQLVKEGKFREDLFYRLNVFPITIPPLRDRRGDVQLLANTLLKFILKADRDNPGGKKTNLRIIIGPEMSGNWIM